MVKQTITNEPLHFILSSAVVIYQKLHLLLFSCFPFSHSFRLSVPPRQSDPRSLDKASTDLGGKKTSKMVNFALSLAATFAVFISQKVAMAAPTTTAASPATGATRFSFYNWTDSIITNPSTALSPQEAVKAFLDSVDRGAPPLSDDGFDFEMATSLSCPSRNHAWRVDFFAQVSCYFIPKNFRCRPRKNNIDF